MKRITAILLVLVLSVPLWAQGKVSTRKYRLADFTDKMTKVVLSGNELLMEALRQEVLNNWTSTTFEFCTLDQFEKLKTQDGPGRERGRADRGSTEGRSVHQY